jgi:hypothetical protein
MTSDEDPDSAPDLQSTVAPRLGTPVLWAKRTWPEIERLGQTPPHLAILPLGTTEQHGRHLPVDVDVKNCCCAVRRCGFRVEVRDLRRWPVAAGR